MDYSLITGAVASIKAAIDIGSNALAVRDGALVLETVTRMNDQLLKAQQALFAHNAELFGLQQQVFEAHDKLREANELLAQRQNHVLVQTSKGQWAYGVNVGPQGGTVIDPCPPQPPHYVCQPCLDIRRQLAVLRYNGDPDLPLLTCPGCDNHLLADLVADVWEG